METHRTCPYFKQCFKYQAYPSKHNSSNWPMAWPRFWGNVVILLKDRLRCRSDGQVTVGSKVSWGPMQLRETFSVPSEGRDSSSTGSNCSWLFCRSSRVRLFKFYIELKNKLKKKKNPNISVEFAFKSFLGYSAYSRCSTWQRADGNSSRLLWLRSRRRRCPSCCRTQRSSIRQDRVSNSLPDRSNWWILSCSLGREEFSPGPNTAKETRHQIRSLFNKACSSTGGSGLYTNNGIQTGPVQHATNYVCQGLQMPSSKKESEDTIPKLCSLKWQPWGLSWFMVIITSPQPLTWAVPLNHLMEMLSAAG